MEITYDNFTLRPDEETGYYKVEDIYKLINLKRVLEKTRRPLQYSHEYLQRNRAKDLMRDIETNLKVTATIEPLEDENEFQTQVHKILMLDMILWSGHDTAMIYQQLLKGVKSNG